MRARNVVVPTIAACVVVAVAATAQPPELPPARKIPGITAEDAFPNACVSCHVQMPEVDARFRTMMAKWTEKVDAKVLGCAQAGMPAGVTLKGRHPKVKDEVFADIPGACLKCHGRTAKNAPYFGRMLHAIHFTGPDNHFVGMFQGECTHCHKLNRETGAWSVPGGAER